VKRSNFSKRYVFIVTKFNNQFDIWAQGQVTFLTTHLENIFKLQTEVSTIATLDILATFRRDVDHAEQERHLVDLMINDLQKNKSYTEQAKVLNY
jgi:hypothetical protein